MKNQHLSINITAGSDPDGRDLDLLCHTTTQFSRDLFKDNGKASCFCQQMSIFHKFYRLFLGSGPYDIGPEFMDGLRGKSEMTHYRDTGGEDTVDRFEDLF